MFLKLQSSSISKTKARVFSISSCSQPARLLGTALKPACSTDNMLAAVQCNNASTLPAAHTHVSHGAKTPCRTEKLILYPHADPGPHKKFTSRIVQFSIVQFEMSQNQSLPMSTTFGRRLFPRSSVILLTDRHRQTDRQTERMITLLRRYQQQTTRRKM